MFHGIDPQIISQTSHKHFAYFSFLSFFPLVLLECKNFDKINVHCTYTMLHQSCNFAMNPPISIFFSIL